jgi:hypothetical protein
MAMIPDECPAKLARARLPGIEPDQAGANFRWLLEIARRDLSNGVFRYEQLSRRRPWLL